MGNIAATIIHVLLLLAICTVGIMIRLFSVIRYEAIIHEYDPWFNYRATLKLSRDGFFEFFNWFDDVAWYPLGRVVGTTVFPGLMITSVAIEKFLSFVLSISIDLRHICVFLAPCFSAFTAIFTYGLTSIADSTTNTKHPKTAPLLAAFFVVLAPGYISRSVAGSYDNEAISIPLLMATFYLWLRALQSGSTLWALSTAISYIYMVAAWGGYVFIINLIPLHVMTLLLMGRYSWRLYTAYSTFYIIATMGSMLVPFVHVNPTRTSDHLAALGTFGIIQLTCLLSVLRPYCRQDSFQKIVGWILALVLLVVSTVIALSWQVIGAWTGRFYALFDTDYAKTHLPIVASVSEHQPTTWASFFFDLHFLVTVFPAGLFMLMKYPTISEPSVFLILYSLTATYFAGVMVRLMLTLTPVICIVAAIAVAKFIHVYLYFPSYSPLDYVSPILSPQKEQAPSPQSQTKPRRMSTPSLGSGSDNSNKTLERKKSSPQTLYTPGSNVESFESLIESSPDLGKPSSTSTTDNIAPIIEELPITSPVYYDVANQTPFHPSKSLSRLSNFGRMMAISVLTIVLFQFVRHCVWVTTTAYSSPSIVLASQDNQGRPIFIDDFREAFAFLRYNVPSHSKVLAWWDYGYQISGLAHSEEHPIITYVDNNTWNNTHIAMVGRILGSSEEQALPLLKQLDVDYILILSGTVSGYAGDDMNKLIWMIRIAQQAFPGTVSESLYYNTQGQYAVDHTASPTLKSSLLYKMTYYEMNSYAGGVDRVRHASIANIEPPTLQYLSHVFSSENFIVRIYRIKKENPLGRLS